MSVWRKAHARRGARTRCAGRASAARSPRRVADAIRAMSGADADVAAWPVRSETAGVPGVVIRVSEASPLLMLTTTGTVERLAFDFSVWEIWGAPHTRRPGSRGRSARGDRPGGAARARGPRAGDGAEPGGLGAHGAEVGAVVAEIDTARVAMVEVLDWLDTPGFRVRARSVRGRPSGDAYGVRRTAGGRLGAGVRTKDATASRDGRRALSPPLPRGFKAPSAPTWRRRVCRLPQCRAPKARRGSDRPRPIRGQREPRIARRRACR